MQQTWHLQICIYIYIEIWRGETLHTHSLGAMDMCTAPSAQMQRTVVCVGVRSMWRKRCLCLAVTLFCHMTIKDTTVMQTPRSQSIGAENTVQARSAQRLNMFSICCPIRLFLCKHGINPCWACRIFLHRLVRWRLTGCQGGAPGTCAAGRVGVTCAECPVGSFTSGDGTCSECAEGNLSLWMPLGPYELWTRSFWLCDFIHCPYEVCRLGMVWQNPKSFSDRWLVDHVRKHREIFCKFGFHQAAYIPTWTNWESVKHPRIGGGVVLLLSIFPAYTVLTEPYSPKIGATGVAWSLLGLIVEIAQNLQVVSTAPTSWPPLMLGITNAVGGLSSSLSGLGGFACIGHAGAVTMYSCQVLIFPAVIGTLAALAFVFRFHFAGVLVHFCNVAIQFDSEAVITHNIPIEQHRPHMWFSQNVVIWCSLSGPIGHVIIRHIASALLGSILAINSPKRALCV